MNCVECGAPLEGHEKFCGACGNRLRRAAAQPPPQRPPAQQRQYAPAQHAQPGRPVAAPAPKPRPNVALPAVLMMVTALVGVALNAIVLVAPGLVLDFAYEFDAPMHQVEASLNPALNLVLLLVNSVIVGGSFSMLRRGSKGLAITAGILSILNIATCCCIVGLPSGIWALVVASKPNAFGP